jgi:hypothetical protein
MAPFPIRIGAYSLLDFGHAKAEATTLEEMKLVDIEFKKHDPSKVVSNHLASCGLKRYEHEDSPHDEIFWGARSFAEVLSRIQALPPRDMAEFLKFQEHRRSCLPQILQGEAPELPVTKMMGAKGAKDSSPSGEKDQGKTREAGTSEQGAEVPQKQEGNPKRARQASRPKAKQRYLRRDRATHFRSRQTSRLQRSPRNKHPRKSTV